ncbi:MAG: UDP-galactopyranose mutase [Acidimicrobiales bacterium]
MSSHRARSFAPRRSFDWLVVGAGLTGATLAERIASQLGQTVLVIDRRGHIAGNAHDPVDENGIRVHRYGAHIFHTSSETVWRYLSGFTDWRPYEHRVLASVSGRLVPLPCNLNTLEALLGERDAAPLVRALVDEFSLGARVPVLRLIEHPDRALAELGLFLYDSVFVNYTVKQWGRRPEDLDPAVTARVPVVISRDNRYFKDPYQALPADGYTTMVSRMLDHDQITVALSTGHDAIGSSVRFKRLVFTGPIDEYFKGVNGPLPYRSLRFEDTQLPAGPYQSTAVVNYPNEHDFTRIIEHAHFSGPVVGPTRITREYPEEYRPQHNEPYYPVPMPASRLVYDQYAGLLAAVDPTTVFAGRLAQYRYLDMDQAVNHALQTFKRSICAGDLAAV